MTLELRLICAAFAVYRLARLITQDEGPFSVFKRLREWAAVNSEGMADLVICPFCLGVWFAAIVAALVIMPTLVGEAILVWLGLAGAQSFLQAKTE